jgi:hypothetical protein
MASELVEQSLEKATTDAAGEAMKIKPAPPAAGRPCARADRALRHARAGNATSVLPCRVHTHTKSATNHVPAAGSFAMRRLIN